MTGEDDEPWTTESDDSWYPPAQDAPCIEVDWAPPEPIGYLEFPDGTTIDIYPERRTFGFARWLDPE